MRLICSPRLASSRYIGRALINPTSVAWHLHAIATYKSVRTCPLTANFTCLLPSSNQRPISRIRGGYLPLIMYLPLRPRLVPIFFGEFCTQNFTWRMGTHLPNIFWRMAKNIVPVLEHYPVQFIHINHHPATFSYQ